MWWTKSLVGKSPSARPQSAVCTPSPSKINRSGHSNHADAHDDEDAPSKRVPNFLHHAAVAPGADYVAGIVPKFERNYRLQEVVDSRDNIKTAAGPVPLLSALVEGAWIQRKPAELVSRKETQTERMQAAVDGRSSTSMKDVLACKYVDMQFREDDRRAAVAEYRKNAAKFKVQNKLGVAALSHVVAEHRHAALSMQAKMDSLFHSAADPRHSISAPEAKAPVQSTPNLLSRRLPSSAGAAAAAHSSTPVHRGKEGHEDALKHWQSPMKRVNASESARLDCNVMAVASLAAQEAAPARRSLVEYIRPATAVASGKRTGYPQAQATLLRGAKLRGADESLHDVAHGAADAAEARNAAYDLQNPSFSVLL